MEDGRSLRSYDFDAREWGELLNRGDVLILDTETSGMDSSAEVLEVGIIDTCGREMLHCYSLPEGSIKRKAIEVHGLDRKSLNQLGAESWQYVHEDVWGLMADAYAVVMYNAEFDIRILCQTAAIHSLPTYDFSVHCAMLAYANYRNEINPRYNNPRWHTLESALKHEGVVAKQEHRALSDCHMVLALMRAVAGDLSNSDS